MTQKNKLRQLGLTCQTRNSGHEIEMTPKKKNHKKLWIRIFNQLNVEEWNWKGNQLEKAT